MLVIVLYHLHYHYYSWIATEFKLGVMIMIHAICVDINFFLKYVQVFNVMFFGLYTSLLFMLILLLFLFTCVFTPATGSWTYSREIHSRRKDLLHLQPYNETRRSL